MTMSLPHIDDAYDLDDEIFEDSAAKSNWNRAATVVGDVFAKLAKHLDSLPEYHDEEHDDVTEQRDRIQEIVQSYTERMNDEGWEDTRKYFTLGQVPAVSLLAAARNEMLDWDDVLNAVALSGKAADIDMVIKTMAAADLSIDYNQALIWAADPGDMAAGIHHHGNSETAAVLLQAGALPSVNGGDLFLDIVREGNKELARLFCRAGKLDRHFSLEYWHENANDYLEAGAARALMRELYWDYGRYEAVDAATLVENKKMKDGAQLRVIFDFAARRVSEIYMLPDNAAPVKTDVGFDDYGPAALRAAREKLTELGGNPPADEPPAVQARFNKPGLRAPAQR